ncbi:MAG: hypothetical protein HYU41_06665 [Candidatus Rokubacteria bacterium]|nr:hypothetical protein [Candidatus Rokubacteria bacterium]
MWRRLATIALLASIVVLPAPAAAQSCPPTRPDSLGPFYVPNAPERAKTGGGLSVTGWVRSATGCRPLAGARIEWWSANSRGDYDEAHRATQVADAQGGYRYETDFPGRYPGRPPHLHLRVSAPGHRTLVTQLYPKSGQAALETDLVLTHRNLIALVQLMLLDINPVEPTDVLLHGAAITHGSGCSIFHHIARGAASAFPATRSFDPPHIFAAIGALPRHHDVPGAISSSPTVRRT